MATGQNATVESCQQHSLIQVTGNGRIGRRRPRIHINHAICMLHSGTLVHEVQEEALVEIECITTLCECENEGGGRSPSWDLPSNFASVPQLFSWYLE